LKFIFRPVEEPWIGEIIVVSIEIEMLQQGLYGKRRVCESGVM
jgi:hypothetical protein